MKLLQLNFLPRSADVALLLLRVWFGVSLVSLHGWDKLANFAERAAKFSDPLGVGSTASLSMSVFAEVVCAALFVAGAFTRLAAVVLMINVGVAFLMVHGHRLTGPANGELALVYFGTFLALFVAGAGKYSVDAQIGAKG